MSNVTAPGPRQYKPNHLRRLDTLSGNECAAPDCTKPLVARDGVSIVSKICHIEAASPNGPRFNALMTDDQRRHYDNLILLCDECHSIIDNLDNVSKYPTSVLKQWKKDHEEKNQLRILARENILARAIDAIANADFIEGVNAEVSSLSVFNINDKLNYNNVVRNRHLIEDYKVFYVKISSLYNELEKAGSFKKEKLLRNVRGVYLRVKGRYAITEGMYMDEVRAHSDDIIEDIEEELFSTCNANSSRDGDDITFGISLIMVDAFMRCKILEEPPK